MLATVSRSGRVESWHRGAVAVVHGDRPFLQLGDVQAPVVCRSATKPLQALPLLARVLDRAPALGDAEIAVMCASHDGTPAHVEAVRALLARGGLDESLLGCGAHAPFDPEARRALRQQGQTPGKVHNNCSGKHAGFLLLAQACGDALPQYLDPHSRCQGEVAASVAAMAGVELPVERLADGCGAPTFVLPLVALARSFARLANPEGLPAVAGAACQRIFDAVGRHPAMLAGERRMCTALVRTARGRLFAKNGAEGVYAVALRPDARRRACPSAVGIAVKVHDGSERGYQAVIVDLLAHLGCFEGGVPPQLASFHVQAVNDTRGNRVGEVRCAVDWSRV